MPYIPLSERQASPHTVRAYLKRAEARLLPYFERDPDWLIDPEGLVGYISGIRKTLVSVSWKQERNSMSYWFSYEGHHALAELVAEMTTEDCFNRRNPPPGGLRTSALRLKGVDEEMEAKLIEYILSHVHSRYSTLAVAWFRVGIVFGARPIEWFLPGLALARPENTKSGLWELTIGNGKNGQNRGLGPVRILRIHTDEALSVLKAFMLELKRHYREDKIRHPKGRTRAKVYSRFLKGCQDVIGTATSALWPHKVKKNGQIKKVKRPCLYSCRHEFVANAKAEGVQKVECAATLGHATDETALRNYSPRKIGKRGSFHISADPAFVELVRKVSKDADFPSIRSSSKSKANPGGKKRPPTRKPKDFPDVG